MEDHKRIVLDEGELPGSPLDTLSDDWAVFCPNNGTEFFRTESEAVKHADELLDSERDHACDYGWNEEVDQIVVLNVTHRTAMVNRQEVDREEDPECEYDYTCDYRLEST